MSPLRIAVLILSFLLLAGCGKPITATHKIKAAYDVNVCDPQLRLFTEATANISLVGHGIFTEGTYFINGQNVSIPSNTEFLLQLTLPIDDPQTIHTGDAVGSLWTSRSISVNGIPAPQIVHLSKGEVSGQVDLVRTLGAFVLGALQSGRSSAGDVRQMVRSLHIEKAVLDVRPGSCIAFGGNRLHLGPDSSIAFKNLAVDNNLDYDGELDMQLQFLDNCIWMGAKSECRFDGGAAHLHLHAQKRGGTVELCLLNDKRNPSLISLSSCVFKFGKERRSNSMSRLCVLHPAELTWSISDGSAEPNFHIRGPVTLTHTRLDLKTDAQETICKFPGSVDAKMQNDVSGTNRQLQFATTASAVAETVKIVISRKATALTVKLGNASVGPASLDKAGEFEFNLENGVAQMKELEWRAQKGTFRLVAAAGSEISIPKGMCLQNSNAQQETQLDLPLDVALGNAEIKTPSACIGLADLNGKILVSVGKEVEVTGNLNFRIPESSLICGRQIDLQARGLDLAVTKRGGAMLRLRHCVAMIPIGAIQSTINEKVPHDWSIDLNKAIPQDEQWRYRNAIAQTLCVHNFELQNMEPQPPDKVTFTAVGDVELTGTVEQGKPMSDKPGDLSWETRPWKMSAHLEGDGTVQYKFFAGSGPGDDRVQYKLDMDVPLPGDVKLDWSQVAHGVLGFVERTVILGHLRKLTVPIKYQGSIPIFKEDSNLRKTFDLTNLVAKRVTNSTEIDFDATAKF